MPLNSSIPVRGNSRTVLSGLVLGLVSLAALPVPVHGAVQPPNTAQSYQEEQAFKVQDIRAINKSLLSDQVKADFKTHEQQYRQLISRGVNQGDARAKAALEAGLKYRVFVLTDSEFQSEDTKLAGARSSLLRDLKGAGRSISNKQQKTAFRRQVCAETLPLLEQCLATNLTGRSLAIGTLADLEVVSAVPGGNVRTEIFDQVDELMVKILNDKEQPDVVKLRVVDEIRRMLLKADNVPQVQLSLANAMAAELKRVETDWEYQFWLTEALARVTAPREVAGQTKPATVLQALAEAAQDANRNMLVRCNAAKGLGRAGFDNQINFDPLAWKTVQLAVEAGLTIGQDPKASVQQRQLCGWYLYFAFHHENKAAAADRRNPHGFLNRAPASETVRDGYSVLLPIARALIFNDPRKLNAAVLGADKWQKANKPASLVYDAASPALKP